MCVRGSRILGAIEELTLEGSGLTDVGARSLSEAVDLANLRVLMVRSSRLTEAGAVALLTAPRLPRLGVLDIHGVPDGYRWVPGLRRRFPRKTVIV
jgi:hypothetical protein